MMSQKIVVVIGAYGSGKSEYAINLAELYKAKDEDVALIDLDVVNPYFRSRDLREDFLAKGIDVICPAGEYKFADLPMISPRISGTILKPEKTVILDVGGDPAGCRALARFTDSIVERGYELRFVVNTMRPFTNNVAGINDMIEMLEKASRLKITEIIANPNLLEETTEEIVASGLELLEEISVRNSIEFKTFLVIDKLAGVIRDGLHGKKRMVLSYYLQKPWEQISARGI
jgi:MinD-like ATPase involved in chromosome partitioning or flagellar assembly